MDTHMFDVSTAYLAFLFVAFLLLLAFLALLEIKGGMKK